MHFSLLPLCWALGDHSQGGAMQSHLEPFLCCRFYRYKVCWLSKLDVLGTCLSGACLKTQGAKCGVQTLHSSGRSWELCVPSQLCVTVCQGRSLGKMLSASPTHFSVGFFPIHLMCRCRLARFPRGNCSICSCRFAVGEGNSGASCVAVLNQNLSIFTVSVGQYFNSGLAESSVQGLTRLQSHLRLSSACLLAEF